MNKFLVLFLLAFSLSIYDIHAECADSLALTPPMGWSSWNCFNSDISEQKIREIADFMVSTGMKDAGYEYLNIDDCWQIGRDEDGNIIYESLLIGTSNCWGFGIANIFVSIIFFIILTFILKWWSSNAKHVPFL